MLPYRITSGRFKEIPAELKSRQSKHQEASAAGYSNPNPARQRGSRVDPMQTGPRTIQLGFLAEGTFKMQPDILFRDVARKAETCGVYSPLVKTN